MKGRRAKVSWDYQSLTAPRGDGLSNRFSHEVQLRVDPIGDFDEEVDGLRSKVAVLRGVAQEIEDGLSNRFSHEVQLRVDPIGDFDEEVDGLRSKVAVLRGVAQEIESETRFQNELFSQLEATMGKAQAGLRNTMRRLNRSLAVKGSNYVTHVVLFSLLCFLGVYLWTKFFR